MKTDRIGKTIFNGFLLLFFALIGIFSFQYSSTTRLIPLAFSVAGVIMMLPLFLVEGFNVFKNRLGFILEKGLISEKADPEGEEEEVRVNKGTIIKTFLALILFAVLLQFVSYLIVIALFLFATLRFIGRTNWVMTFSIVLGTWVFIYTLFEVILDVAF